MIDGETKTVFAGLSRGGVQASRDGGKTWAAKAKGLDEADVYSLNLVRNGGASKLYCGIEPAHLYESDDLGETWRDVASIRNVGSVPKWNFPWPPHIGHVKDIAITPSDSRTIYISVEQGALLKSTDGGRDLEGSGRLLQGRASHCRGPLRSELDLHLHQRRRLPQLERRRVLEPPVQQHDRHLAIPIR